MKLKRSSFAVVAIAVGALGAAAAPNLSAAGVSVVQPAVVSSTSASPLGSTVSATEPSVAAADPSSERRRGHCGPGGVFCAGASTGDITPPITSPQWAYTARNCPEATAVDLSGHTQDPQNHIEEGQVYLLHGGPSCTAGKVSPDTDLYAKTWPPTVGTFGRLQANAYVLDDGKGQRLAIVQADLGGIPGELHTFVAKQVAQLGIDQAHLLISATHDHGSVGGMWIGQGYALLGGDEYDPRVFDAVGTGIVNAIKQANASLTPAKMAYGFGSVDNANHNRDTGSWSLDPEANPANKVGDPTNAPRLMVMRIDTVGGVPLGVISNYANHGVIHGTFNYYYSGDNQGSTTRLASRGIRAAATAAGVKFPPGWTVVDSMINGAVGDITPVADHGPWPDSAFQTWGDASGFDDPNYMQFATMENGGMRQAPEAVRVWQSLASKLSSNITLDARFDYVCFCAQQVPDDPFDPYSHAPYVPANDDPAYNRVSLQAVLGGGGISDVPSLPSVPGAPPLPSPSGPCGSLNCFPTTVIPSHHLERPTLMASAGVSPYNARVQVIRINDLALAGMPGEPTIEMGRRIERSILRAAPGLFHNAITVGLANDYVSYFPTIQEYEAYHYEGSFSLFGQQTGNVLKARLVHLAQLMQGGQPVEPCTIDRACVTPPDTSFLALTPEPLVPDLNAGTVEAQPVSVQRFGGTNFQWVGGGPGAEWNQGQPMVQVQRQVEGAWTTVASDMDTEVLVHYAKTGGLNHWEAFLDTTKDWPTGSYRFHVTGHYATGPAAKTPYTIDSAVFGIAPYGNLTLTRIGAGTFEVDYPAPTAGVTYRYRQKPATGATVNGVSITSFHLAPGQSVVIPAGAIKDAFGNYNAAPVTLTG